jgi:D-glutamate cyclase
MASASCSSTTPQQASIVKVIIDKIQYDVIGTDAGNRGMKPLIVPGDLQRAAQCLVQLPPASRVVILSGFPCCVHCTPPTETDGPPGTLAIARAAHALGHSVVIVTDKCNKAVFEAALRDLAFSRATATITSYTTSPPSMLVPHLSLQVFPSICNEDEEARLSQLAQDCDILIACERAGPSKDGNCYTMRGINMTEMGLIAPLHRLVLEKSSIVSFLAVGDGGNELGMGKVIGQIRNNPQIQNGDKIGCVISADYLIAASVSNWGGYALAAATALLKAESLGRRTLAQEQIQELNNANDETATTNNTFLGLDALLVQQWLNWCLPTEDEEVALLDRCVAAGCRDGVSGKMEATVDGMPLERSLQCLRKIKSAVLLASSQVTRT